MWLTKTVSNQCCASWNVAAAFAINIDATPQPTTELCRCPIAWNKREEYHKSSRALSFNIAAENWKQRAFFVSVYLPQRHSTVKILKCFSALNFKKKKNVTTKWFFILTVVNVCIRTAVNSNLICLYDCCISSRVMSFVGNWLSAALYWIRINENRLAVRDCPKPRNCQQSILCSISNVRGRS